jgi:hypothetical protein
LGDTQWPRTNHLEFRDPPTRLSTGQPFEAELVDRGGPLPDDVRILYRVERDGRREVQSDWMTRVGDVMVARRDDVRASFEFRAAGGDDHTMRWNQVEVVEPPQLETLTLTTHPPAYTGGHPAQIVSAGCRVAAAEAQRHLEVLAGTGIEVSGTASEPLAAARILIDGQSITAAIGPDAAGVERHAFHVSPHEWVAAESGKYRLELENADAVAGIAGEWNLRVEPDTPPSIAWQQPTDDLFVLASATVPLELSVKDNLAIGRVELRYTRSDQSQDAAASIELYRGPEAVPAADAKANDPRGESRTVDYMWPLAPLELSVGTQLVLHAAASDYRPGTGETAAPRRIAIINRAELDARVADRLAQLVRRLDENLTLQRTTREGVRRLEIQLRDAGRLSDGGVDALAAAELNQRQVGRGLADPSDGLPALAGALVAELDTNGVEDSDARTQIEELTRAIGQLSAEPLPAAERELTAARKAAQTPADNWADSAARIGDSLAAAGHSQDEVIAELERLLDRLSESADLGRLVRDLAQLRADQLAHRESTRTDVGLETLPLEWIELSREQQATLHQAAAAQDALARRYERIERGLETLARELADQDAASRDRLADAIELARQLGIADHMRQATRELGDNRVGQALAREQQIADAIEQVLDTLRDREESQTDRLVAGLRAAERELAALRDELAELRKQTAGVEQQPGAAADGRRQQLHQRQQQLRERIERLARQLDRLQAPAAGQSAGQAAEKLADKQSQRDPRQPNEQQPASRERVEQAEQDLAEAARQLAQRRREAEQNLAREFLQRVQVALAAMVADQREVVERTAELDAAGQSADRLTDAERRAAAEMADQERTLADEAHAQSEMIAGLHVFVLALGQAADHLTAAATRLDQGDAGAATQRAELQALARLEEIVAALDETAAETDPNQQPPGGAGAGQQPGSNQSRPPAFDLFEVKLLRSLQGDLNRRTGELQQRPADELSASDAPRADRDAQAAELAAEQSRLAELVQELLSRDNEPDDDE